LRIIGQSKGANEHLQVSQGAPSAEPASPVRLTVAVVLAGGEGRRMGGCKPLRRFGTSTLIARALGLARSYCSTVAIAVSDREQISGAVNAEQLIDRPGITGPLAGIASALDFGRREGATHVLSLPCDAPQLPADLKDRLEAALSGDGPATVAIAESAGRLHPVCAIWPTSALEALVAYAASGRSSLKDFAGELCMTIVGWDPAGGDPFANANTPAELAALQPERAHRTRNGGFMPDLM
jgi:molybdopterin-guanine dinucleotide biosynthesis protein A